MLIAELKKRPMIGFCLMYPAAGIVERVGADWDWIWIDAQHGQLDYKDVLEAVRTCNLIKRPSVVRVPDHSPGNIGKYLDTGADAIMVPMVNSADEARAIVWAAKFPPMGMRSYGGRRVIDLWGRKYANADHPQPMLICQIETHQAMENAEEIIKVDGVDMIFFGPDDMAMQDGLKMEQKRPDGYFSAQLEKIAKLTKKYGKLAGSVFVNPDDVKYAIELGYRLILSSADVVLLAKGSKEASTAIRAVVDTSRNNSTDQQGGIY